MTHETDILSHAIDNAFGPLVKAQYGLSLYDPASDWLPIVSDVLPWLHEPRVRVLCWDGQYLCRVADVWRRHWWQRWQGFGADGANVFYCIESLGEMFRKARGG